MRYYFEKGKELAYIKAESLEEHEILLRIPYVRKSKTKSVFGVSIKYLVNLNRGHELTPDTPADKDILRKRIDKIRYLDSLSNELKHKGFNYQVYLRKSAFKMHGFQQVGVEFLVKAKKCILADDVGLGKTIQALVSLCHVFHNKEITGKVIIITKSSCKYQWKDAIRELIDTEKTPELKKNRVVVVHGSRKRRREMYNDPNIKVYLMNYEQFIHDYASLVMLSRDVEAVIADEASKIKNISAKRTEKIKTLLGQCKIKWSLTAAPIENKLMDLFSLIDFIDRGIFLNVKWFKKKYCEEMSFRLGPYINGQPVGPKITKIKSYKNLNDAKLKIKGLYLRRTAEMVGVQLPKFIVTLRLVELEKEQRKLYDKVRDIEGMAIGKKRAALRRIINDPVKFTKGALKKNPKVEELLECLEENNEAKAIVFSQYKKFTDLIVKNIKDYNPLYIHGGVGSKDRERYRKAFNKKEKHRVLVMTSAGEEGIDTPSGSIVYNMDLPENPQRLKQRCGRIRRMSSKFKNVRIINIFAIDTIEDKTVKNIFKKMDLFTKFFAEDNANLVSGKSFYKGMHKKRIKELL